MEALSFIDHLINEWEIIVGAFVVGGVYYEAKRSFRKIMTGLENTSTTHREQNVVLDTIHSKIDDLDKRMSKIEGSLEMVIIENHDQTVRLSVIETRQEFGEDKPTRKRRQSVQ